MRLKFCEFLHKLRVIFYLRFLPLDVFLYIAKRREGVRKQLSVVFPRT